MLIARAGHWLLSIIRQYAFRALRLSKSAFSVVSFPVVKTNDIECAPLEGRTCRSDIYTLRSVVGWDAMEQTHY